MHAMIFTAPPQCSHTVTSYYGSGIITAPAGPVLCFPVDRGLGCA
jgi:hypothetical protein